jgi:hypothetical protein
LEYSKNINVKPSTLGLYLSVLSRVSNLTKKLSMLKRMFCNSLTISAGFSSSTSSSLSFTIDFYYNFIIFLVQFTILEYLQNIVNLSILLFCKASNTSESFDKVIKSFSI